MVVVASFQRWFRFVMMNCLSIWYSCLVLFGRVGLFRRTGMMHYLFGSKKGDLSLCDNWRGISLLDVVGKVFAKVIQQHLQKVVEEVVADL